MSRRYPLIVTLVVGALLVAATFGTRIPELGESFLGIEYVDHYGTQWFYWFVDRQVRLGEQLGHTDLFFYPYGKDIYLHTGTNVLDAFFAIPFRRLLGPILGYNVFVILAIGLSAVAFSRFARQFTSDRLAVGVGSLLFAFSPYVLFEALEGRPTQAILFFPVLYMHFMWKAGITRGLKWPVLAGLMLALSGYQYWFYALFGGVAGLGHGFWRFVRPVEGAGGRKAVLARHVLMAVVAVGLCLPGAAPLFMAAGAEGEVPGLIDASQWSLFWSPPIIGEDNSIGLFIWQPLRRAVGFLVMQPDLTEHFLLRVQWTPLVFLPFLLFYLVRPGRLHRGPVLCIFLVLTFIAAGPLFVAGRYALPNPVYIYLVKAFGFMQRLWWSGRAYAFLAILIPAILVTSIAWFRRFGPRVQVGVVAVLVVGWIWDLHRELMAPYPTWDASVPAGYQCLASGPDGAIIELPYSWTQAHLYYQSIHGRPILGGMIENNPNFTPEEQDLLREENTFVKRLLEIGDLDRPKTRYTLEDKKELGDLGYRYVVVQKDAFLVSSSSESMQDNVLKTRLRRMRKELVRISGRPVYEDPRLAIFAPWGGPPPCDSSEVDLDDDAVGRPVSSNIPEGATAPGRDYLIRMFRRIPDDPIVPMDPNMPAGQDAFKAAASPQGPDGADRRLKGL